MVWQAEIKSCQPVFLWYTLVNVPSCSKKYVFCAFCFLAGTHGMAGILHIIIAAVNSNVLSIVNNIKKQHEALIRWSYRL
jgi:succinate dehydrogenase/fumarate reductase cytochrome b subunit